MKRFAFVLALTLLLSSALFSFTRLQFEWSSVLRGAPAASPLIEGDNIYVISQDRQLSIFNLNGKLKTTWGGDIRFYPYLMKGMNSGEIYVVTMDNVIYKLVGGKPRWKKHIPFLSGEPVLTKDGYLLFPVEGGSIRVFLAEEEQEILSIDGDGELVLPMISDPWGRFYLATKNKVRGYNSWGDKTLEVSLPAAPITWLFSRNGYLIMSLENNEVVAISLLGQIENKIRNPYPIIQILERQDGNLLIINELGRVTLTDPKLRNIKTRHFGIQVDVASILNHKDLILLSDKYWILVDEDLEITQVFKGAHGSLAVNYSENNVLILDKKWTLFSFSFRGIPLSDINSWTLERGDSSLQGRVVDAVAQVDYKGSFFDRTNALKDNFSIQEVNLLIEEASKDINKDPTSNLAVEKLDKIMQAIIREANRRGNITGLSSRFKIYDLLGSVYNPQSQMLLIRYGYWDKTVEGTKYILNSLRAIDNDPRGLSLTYMLYAIDITQANADVITVVLDIIEELLDKGVYLNPKKVNNIFSYILRKNVSNSFKDRIKFLKAKVR